MSGSMLSSAGLDPRRRRILFRAWRRGLREMDLALGQFADAEPAELGDEEIDEFERWLDAARPGHAGLDHRRGADAGAIRHAAVRAPARGAARGDRRERPSDPCRRLNAPPSPAPHRLRRAARSRSAARPRASTPSSSPISRARWRSAGEEPRGARWPSSRATRCARRASSTPSPSPRPRSRRSICPAGTASPTIASRPTRRFPPQRMTALARLARDARRARAAARAGRLPSTR